MEDALLWHTHGGEVYTMTRSDYLDLDVDQRDWLLERAREHREKTSAEFKAASKGK